ncbi:hypothetical protein B0H13DRAFT_2090874 [Mycena leptocephala]|nr:hypothetical protein B0H13DRAFT_2090874 [Mycena leptocephala]
MSYPSINERPRFTAKNTSYTDRSDTSSSGELVQPEVLHLSLGPTKKESGFSAAAVDLADKLSGEPGLFITLLLLVLLGLRPQRLSNQLRANNERAWEAFRDGLVKRWETVMITTGLAMGASASALFSDKVETGSYLMALASLCCSIIAITFGTGLTFVVKDAPAEHVATLARRPLHMIFVLSLPTFFAIGAMLCLYACITALAYQQLDTEVVDILARFGTTAGAGLMVAIFLVSAWIVWDLPN